MHRPLFSRVLRFPTGAPFPRCNGLVMQLPGFQEKAFCSGITSLAVTSPSMQALTSSWLAAQLETVGVPPGAELALAVSGGMDSMALAVLAARLPGPPATALVVDHALRPESAGEAQQVAAWLERLGLLPRVLTLEWPQGRPPPGKVQEAARNARYSALGSVCHERGLAALLTAHHWDDQAELLLIRLARASGLTGLAGMAASSYPHMAGGPLHLVRPLLGAKKVQLRRVCEAAGQAWVEDPSNATPVYLRNRVRAVLQDPQAGLASNDIAAALEVCGQLRSSLEQQVQNTLARATRSTSEEQHILDLPCLASCPPAVQAAAIQRLVHLIGPPRGGRPVRNQALTSLLHYLAKDQQRPASFLLGRTAVQTYPGKGTNSRIVFTRRDEDYQTPSQA